MLLSLFLIELAAGLLLFLPLVGRRNAGVKFYRLILMTSFALVLCAAVSHGVARQWNLVYADGAVCVLQVLVYLLLRFPKRLVFQLSAGALGAGFVALSIAAFHLTVRGPILGTIAGALSSVAILGTVTLAMLLGHWYLVVRGMPIEPLERLSRASLAAAILKTLVVTAALISISGEGFVQGGLLHRVMIANGIFFWMRVGWGLAGPVGLYPMIIGTVKIRSTMAATGILYVAVVAVVIGEVLGIYLSVMMRLPL